MSASTVAILVVLPGAHSPSAPCGRSQHCALSLCRVGCGRQSSFFQPYFSGFGGIRMVLVPNGITYWYVSDGGQYEMANEIREVGIIEPICQKAAVAVEI